MPKMRDMEKLKPCPFCGAKVSLEKYIGSFFVRCENGGCDIRPEIIRLRDTKEEAIAAWNRRQGESNA